MSIADLVSLIAIDDEKKIVTYKVRLAWMKNKHGCTLNVDKINCFNGNGCLASLDFIYA